MEASNVEKHLSFVPCKSFLDVCIDLCRMCKFQVTTSVTEPCRYGFKSNCGTCWLMTCNESFENCSFTGPTSVVSSRAKNSGGIRISSVNITVVELNHPICSFFRDGAHREFFAPKHARVVVNNAYERVAVARRSIMCVSAFRFVQVYCTRSSLACSMSVVFASPVAVEFIVFRDMVCIVESKFPPGDCWSEPLSRSSSTNLR